jgi:hypothetical protein
MSARMTQNALNLLFRQAVFARPSWTSRVYPNSRGGRRSSPRRNRLVYPNSRGGRRSSPPQKPPCLPEQQGRQAVLAPQEPRKLLAGQAQALALLHARVHAV